jgi:hypothetical protein
MTPPTFADYLNLRPHFAVTRELAQSALDWAQPPAMEALGVHRQRQTLVEGELPAYIVMTTPETNGGWGELMPVWFKPYERPVPLHCLDNWALLALLYRSAFGRETDTSAFTIENLVRVVVGADLLIPFLPSTDGAGRFLRHGAMPVLLALLWLAPEARGAWLAMHECGARKFAKDHHLQESSNLREWLEQVENDAFLVPERERVAGEAAVSAFLADATRANQYSVLFGGLCLSVSALAAALGGGWQRWVFQAVNVGYRTTDFALPEIGEWLARTASTG